MAGQPAAISVLETVAMESAILFLLKEENSKLDHVGRR